jgi:iron-sulfur cluster repair protein YtfE (RIC family)
LSDLKLTDLVVGGVENPLDFIADDLVRERQVCAMIDSMVSDGHPEEGIRKQVVSFLTVQLPRHLLDEEVDLFPLMQARCTPEDEIEKVISRLHSDHVHAR